MNPHRLTKVQRKVLGWMADRGGRMAIVCGVKTTCLGIANGLDGEVIGCQAFVPDFLRHHGYIRWVVPDPQERYRSPIVAYRYLHELTDKGWAAIQRS